LTNFTLQGEVNLIWTSLTAVRLLTQKFRSITNRYTPLEDFTHATAGDISQMQDTPG